MADNTAYQFNPYVVEIGDAYIDKIHFKGAGGTHAKDTWKAGELLRICAGGTVQGAQLDTNTTGACNAIALSDETRPAATKSVPILVLAENTILRGQVHNATPSDAEPRDMTIGSSYALVVSSNKWSVSTDTTNGIATVYRKPSDSAGFDEYRDADRNYGVVDFYFAQSVINGRGSETS